MAQTDTLQFVPQTLPNVPAIANRVEVFGRAAARLDAQQRLEPVLNADQAGHGGIGWRGHLLREVVHAAGAHATSAGRLQVPGQKARQHRLANAITPDQAGGSLVEGFAQLGEKRPAIRQGVGHAFEREIGIRHASFHRCQALPCCRGWWRLAVMSTAASMAHGTNTSVKMDEGRIITGR